MVIDITLNIQRELSDIILNLEGTSFGVSLNIRQTESITLIR